MVTCAINLSDIDESERKSMYRNELSTPKILLCHQIPLTQLA